MIDLAAVKQVTRIVSDPDGNQVAQIPLDVWENLIAQLDELISMQSEDQGWLELSSKSFEFWNNDEDAVYDNL